MDFVSPVKRSLIQGWKCDITGIEFVRHSPGRAELYQLKVDAMDCAREAAEAVVARFGNRGRTVESFAIEYRMLVAELTAAEQQ